MQSIPFKDNSQFREQLQLNGETFILIFAWNALNEFWTMSIYDGDFNPIAFGIKIVTQYNLTKQIVASGMPKGQIICQNITGGFGKIERHDMGRNVELVFYTDGELA